MVSVTQIILVPQGAEYQAVCRGLSRISITPSVLPIPVGTKALKQHLQQLQQAEYFSGINQILVMGLCGSLTSCFSVGNVVLYQDCVYKLDTASPRIRLCDRTLTNLLQEHLQKRASLVRGLTSDRLVWLKSEKRHLNQIYSADVVDMEGFAALDVLTQAGIAVAMLRVISDDCHHDIPELTSALSPDGKLQPLPLAMKMLKQPIAATRLISGALRGLKVLQEVTATLFDEGGAKKL